MKSNRFIKLLDWYIIKKFLGTYVFAIALIISIAVVFDFNEKMDKFMEREAPWSAIVFDYYMNFIPYFANLFSPLFVFIAVIFFTSKLAENSEIIAMFSTGMSFKRLMRPYMISAAVIAVAPFMLGSYVIPKGSVTRLNFEDRYVKSKKKGSATNVQLEVDSGVIAYIDRYQDYNKTGNRFSLDKFVDKKLVSHLTARRIVYDTTTVNKWTIHDYMIRELDGLKENIIKGDRLDTIINMDPTDFLIMKNQQEMLTSPQLSEYIDKQRATCQQDTCSYHSRPAEPLPEGSGKESSGGTANEIGSHENSIDAIGCLRTKGKCTCLIAELDALHPYIYQQNTGYDTCITILSRIEHYPCTDYQRTSYISKPFHPDRIDEFSDGRSGQCPGYATKSQHSYDIVSRKERRLFHLESQTTPHGKERSERETCTQRSYAELGILLDDGK